MCSSYVRSLRLCSATKNILPPYSAPCSALLSNILFQYPTYSLCGCSVEYSCYIFIALSILRFAFYYVFWAQLSLATRKSDLCGCGAKKGDQSLAHHHRHYQRHFRHHLQQREHSRSNTVIKWANEGGHINSALLDVNGQCANVRDEVGNL